MAAAKERRVIEEDLANVEFETSEDVEVRKLYLPSAFLMRPLKFLIKTSFCSPSLIGKISVKFRAIIYRL